MGKRSFIAVMAALAVIALLTFGLFSNDTPQVAIGEPAPDAPVQRLGDEGSARLADFEGKWVLVNFWASWCGPCRTESPAIQEYADDHRDQLVVVGMNTEDLTEDATDFVAEFGLTWEMLRDNEGERKDAFGVVALPESFLLDPEGRVALARRGAVDEEYLEDNVTPFLMSRSPEA